MKRIKYLIIFGICFLLLSSNAYAASVSIKGAGSVTKGNSVTVTATVSSESPLVSIEGTLMCKGAGVSNGLNMQYDDSSNQLYSKSYSVTVKPTETGSISCYTTGVRITNMSSDSWQSLSDKSMSISVSAPAAIKPKTYSSNNNLKSLSVEGYSLNKSFSKDTLEYELEVPNGIEKVNIKAELEDKTAEVKGLGEIKVSEGSNKLEIKVTAENGNVKTYIINVTVKELDPIEVTVGKDKYVIVRKEGIIDPPENYEKSTIKIKDQDVLCYKNNKTKNILIGLKDSKGTAKYFSYNEKNNTFTEYNGYKIGGLYLDILNMPKDKLPNGYSKVSFKYDDNKLEGYQKINSSNNDFYLIYALNEVTGMKNLYVYDKKENTIQRYDDSIIKSYKEKADNYFLYLLISLAVLAVTIITFSILLMKKKKHKSKYA